MATSALVVSGVKTVADVYALITAPGAIITSVQFGIGSGNSGGSIYVNQLETSVYRAGMTTTFGQPSPFDQDVTPDAIFGSGNANGGFAVAREDGIELGLRSKLRFPLHLHGPGAIPRDRSRPVVCPAGARGGGALRAGASDARPAQGNDGVSEGN